MRRKTLITNVAFIALIGLVLLVVATPQSDNSTVIPTHFENENLLKQIQTYANKNNSPPIDAKIDPIWKLIPGYNGLDIDVEESYVNMRANGQFDEHSIVFNETSPGVHFTNLTPAPIYKGNPEKPMVTLLINVAWGDEFIPPILATLKKHDVRATFFFDGSWTKKTPKLAKAIYNDNHEIGNHAYSHPDLSASSYDKTINELKMTNNIIEETLNIKPKWFAPPSGSFNDETVKIARELDMFTILWTVDTIDWRKPNTSQMVKRVVSEVHNGAMILMHPTQPTAEGLDDIITNIKKKGYKLGTVSDMMDENRILPENKTETTAEYTSD